MTARLSRFCLACVVMVGVSIPRSLRADEADLEFFEKKIRPVLMQHCYECHAVDAKKVGGGLLLDSRDGVARGGESGAVVVAKKPEASLLIQAIRYADDSVKMPPKGKLPAAVIADFEEWVRRGTPDPRDNPLVGRSDSSWEAEFRERAKWWSLQPVRDVAVPTPKDAAWSDQAIDRFVLAKLEEIGLQPAAVTSPRTLARRLSLVLTGLPPTPEQVAEFVEKCREHNKPSGMASNDTVAPIPPVVVAEYVDALLNSPHFGERWARHWMDVVRFTETHGNEWNYEVHHAWRYRDYLIRAFNADVPFDQLVVEHIAGDLLPVRGDGNVGWVESSRLTSNGTHTRPIGGSRGLDAPYTARLHPAGHFNESPIGTGFFRFGEVNHDDCISLPDLGYDIADNQLDTLTKAFQATTVACARCHDHKLDAVSMRDYYALLGVIRSSRLVAHTIDSPTANVAVIARLRELKSEMRRELASLWRRDAESMAKYMLAAEAAQAKKADAAELATGLDAKRLEKWVATLAAEKQPLEDVFEPWRRVVGSTRSAEEKRSAERGQATGGQATGITTFWNQLAEQFAKEDRERTEFNQSQFVSFGDFRKDEFTDWQLGGQSMQQSASSSGEFVLQPEGDSVVRAILPAGRFTHAMSDKLNGTLRSPMIPLGKKHISFQVLGERSSAVRLVSNNCQLNYKNYRALTKPELSWLTFSPPDERDQLRTYAELMTMFDNPKFPDQLSALGGDAANYRLPWEKAAENPRSYFGVTRVVLHDSPEPPKAELSHLRRLFDVGADDNNDATASGVYRLRYVSALTAALDRWADGNASDDDSRWLDAFVRRELLTNQAAASPKLDDLVKQFRRAEAELALPTVVAGIGDGGPGFAQPVFARGDCRRPGEVVPRRYLEVLANTYSELAKPFDAQGSGRMQLALQIASKDNPLTARVFVNRVWHHLFGTGLVRSVDDFGHVGDLPSHPELLDHLATQFVRHGWSIKQLVRSIVLTKTFQQASTPSSQAKELDPQNRWLSHYPARRLEAEAIRDAILATSGRLDRTLFGMSVHPFREKEYADRRLFPGPLDGAGRRSIYIKNNLMESPKFLGAFNIPGGKVTQGRRDVTNVPAQALALLNDPFVIQQAGVWADQLVSRSDESVATRMITMFQAALSRQPTTAELIRFEEVVLDLAKLHRIASADLLTNKAIWQDVAHAMFNLKEFIYVP